MATCTNSGVSSGAGSTPSGQFLDDSESDFFDGITSELNQLAGSEINYYGQNLPKSTIDPLYGEPTERKIDGPWRVHAWVKWPTVSPSSEEQGFSFQFDGECTIARAELERVGAPPPFEGDIIEMWRTPFHDADSLGKGLFFDVVKVTNDGHINDTPSFVQFRLTLKRRTQFGAERKVSPP
jgi:hypothetical protein